MPDVNRRTLLKLLPAFYTAGAISAEKEAVAPWVPAMAELHRSFKGTAGQVAQFGDSITYTMAFWKPFSWSDPDRFIPDDKLPKRPAAGRWRDVIKGAGDDGKGPEAGNYSGWRAADLLLAVPKVLAATKPEAAIIMIGSNDARGNKLSADYADNLTKIVTHCLEAKCIPILSTIPPMRGAPDSVAKANEAIQSLATKLKLPWVDYHAAILFHAPGEKWDGTLISGDGVHPSAGETNDLSEENVKKSGLALRNRVTFLKLREVWFRVLHPGEVKPD
jgi:lysophospholipase L1-like esterase